MKKILLVEDDQFIIDVYSLKFKNAGFSVASACSGQEALSKLKEEKPDIILLDLVLPDIDGWEILKKIRSDNTLADSKVAILSNLGSKKELDKGEEFNVDKYLVKAKYTPTQIVEEIKNMLK